jgi:hypothetical protein
MISISNIFHEYKHLLPIQSQNKYLFEINRNNKSHIFTNIYKHQTLADLHKNIALALYPLSSQSVEMVELKAHSHEQYTSKNKNKNKNVSLSGIRDIFLYNNNTCKILSIPQDESITLIEFIDSNQDYFTPMYYRPFPEIFKIYVIDNDFVNKQTQYV